MFKSLASIVPFLLYSQQAQPEDACWSHRGNLGTDEVKSQ